MYLVVGVLSRSVPRAVAEQHWALQGQEILVHPVEAVPWAMAPGVLLMLAAAEVAAAVAAVG